ncbi:1-phosphatidylinositol phosphodiesterase [Ceratocystis lukuohia]|uniref:1-phosphatidylinositol phosphodiesterase n=1 Tax=Ceratocystis lukuohia TaxID=2019550 RepID=A0ABR4MAC3_9PEZI
MRLSLLTTLACLAFSHAGQFKGIYDTWSFDLGSYGQYPDWMGNMKDDVLLSQLVIPGTHNSMTDRITNDLFQSQNVPLARQLEGGIRYIDVSCRYIDYNMMVYNGLVNTGYSLGDVLTTMYDFLNNHPSETIILRIQKSALGDSEAFLSFIERYFVPGIESDNQATQHIYSRNANDFTIPTLGELRGKILILQDFETSPPGRYGIPWNSHSVSSYSHRLALASGRLFLGLKWAGIKDNLRYIPSRYSNMLRITHTTAGFGVRPIKIAAKKGYKYGMNKFLGRYLLYGEQDCYGVVVMDFPGNILIEELLRRNNKHQTSEPAPVVADELDFDTVSVDEAPPVEFSDDEASDDEAPPFEFSGDEASDDETSDNKLSPTLVI